jgi:hypothetical protein
MKKLICFIAVMFIAGAVVAEEYITVRVTNESSVDLAINAGLTLLDRTKNPTRGLHYIPDSEKSSKKIDARKLCEIKFRKPTIPDYVDLGKCQMQIRIIYGESSLDAFQYSDKFDIQVDREKPDRLTIVSDKPDVVEFTIEADPWTEYK